VRFSGCKIEFKEKEVEMEHHIGELLSLDGKFALVTGGATGIGEGIATVLSQAGANVVIGDIDLVGARRVAEQINGVAVSLDVTDADAVAAAVEQFRDRGGLDIVVNNAGTYREAGSILDQTHDSWHRSIDVNLVSVFNCSKPAAKLMVEQGRGGSIVNIASVDGMLPCLGTGYDTAKAGVIHFTKSLAVDLAPHGIRVNGVNPGNIPVETLRRIHSGELPPLWPTDSSVSGLMGPLMRQRSKNIPIGRTGTAEEIGHAVLFLCSSAATYITGHTVTVDGGWTLV
jgi:NAD(P)-dependent dehydrogenase (short-subunit alcohol dehydrogenase family)